MELQILAQYPINPSAINPIIGRPIGAVMANGDLEYGVVDRIHDGNLVLRPLDGAAVAAVQNLSEKIKSHPEINRAINKAKTRGFGGFPGYGGYPYGWGYGNFGWGAGWWWILPLFILAAIVSFPFWW